MKATIQDIARELEISMSTVSRSLRQDPSIHPRTRARVAETALRLGYEGRQQRGSRSTATKRSLGILLRSGENPAEVLHENAMRMLQGITEECDRREIPVLLHTLSTSRAGKLATHEEFIPPSVRDHTCDALILIGPHEPADVLYLSGKVPTVSLSWMYAGATIDVVLADNIQGIRAKVDQVVGAGHTNLAWVPAQYEASFYQERFCGFALGCLNHGLPLDQMVRMEPYPQEEMRDRTSPFPPGCVEAALQAGVTAFVCANDTMAFALAGELAAMGLRVPEDVSLTGFDAMTQRLAGDRIAPTPPSAARPAPPGDTMVVLPGDRVLSGVDPHFGEAGKDAVRLALRRLENPTARAVSLTIASSSVDGHSVAQVARR